MPRLLRSLSATAGLAAAGCARAPWWPEPAAAAPSPLLEAVGLAPPPLTGPGCYRDAPPPLRFAGWRGAATYLRRGPGFGCVVVVAPVADSEPPRTASVLADARGRVYGVEWRGPLQSASGARAAADSVVRQGLRAPGAAPCDSQPARTGPGGLPWPEVRGWRTPAYEALVFVDPVTGPGIRGHALRVAVGRGGFALCRGAGARRPAA